MAASSRDSMDTEDTTPLSTTTTTTNSDHPPKKHENNEQQQQQSILCTEHQNVTILALRMSSRKRLGMFLNNADALPNPVGLLPNYQGLAELIGFEFIEQLSFQRERDPTMALLMEWGNRAELAPTLGNLVEFLTQLERLDVLEDCCDMIRNDAEHYLKKKTAGSSDINPVQDSTVSQSPFNIDDMKVDETTFMTIQDVEAGRPTYYDAFICYHPEGEDLKFVKEMITRVEAPPYNLRLFVPHRDDLPGASKYTISAKLIQDRCKRMVIVISPRYLQSDACDFQTKFAHALSPGSRSKKLVPVLIQYCATPNILRHVTLCDYTRADMKLWFWERLTKSLQAPLNPADITLNTSTDLSALKLNIRGEESVSLSPSTFCQGAELGVEALPKGAESNMVTPPTFSRSSAAKPTSLGGQSPTKTGWMESLGGGGDLRKQNSGCSTPSQEASSPSPTSSGGKKKGFPMSPLSSPISPCTPPASPSTDRKCSGGGVGGQTKKKGLRSKLTSVFSLSSHSSTC